MDRQALRLFNCQPDGRAPDWSRFLSLEIGGCIDHDGTTEGGVSADRAHFFTVYARDHEGMAEAITDTLPGETLADAARIGAELASLSGLPCALAPSLDPAAHVGGSGWTVRMFAPPTPCPAAVVDPDRVPPPDIRIVAGLCVLFAVAWGAVFGGGAAVTAFLAALFRLAQGG